MLFGFSQIGCNHILHHFIKRDFWHPAKFLLGFGGVAEQGLDFGVAEIAGIDSDDAPSTLTPALSADSNSGTGGLAGA